MENGTFNRNVNLKEAQKELQFSQLESRTLRSAIKCGIYKELYKKQMLTESQLNELLSCTKGAIQ